MTETEKLERLGDLERRHDGPIPKEDLEVLRFGSGLEAEIARTEAEVRFHKGEIEAFMASVRRWLNQCNAKRAIRNAESARESGIAWRAAKLHLARLKGERAQQLGTQRVHDIIQKVTE